MAVYLAFAQDFVRIETLPITVTEDGKTLIDEDHGVMIDCATEWADKDAFLNLLTERLQD